MEEGKVVKKRVRDELEVLESDIDSPEVKRLRENLLDSLDDDSEICTSTQDLDSFMKSFEEEITASPSAAGGGTEVGVIGVASDSGESRLDLGYLLEASDDELGIPPPNSPGGVKNELRSELVRVESDPSEIGGGFWEIPNYDAFGFGFGEMDNYNGNFGHPS
ncbi:Non-specific serine/threonine protein kinase [Handroanthus impetiginosus]|uniref:Non-specific serine/threonine protein kinase n=1 Tax=Handroanthus impetiginosus TaxID=429701 RepID=A0A2G9GKZ8_9LAMI|nr:Non-specific serine/threonine protein kinase [Handroanthus impetiginosus]